MKISRNFYKTLNLKFSIVCFSETWANDNNLGNDSLIQLPGYNVLHQVSIFVYESLSFKRREDLGINSEAVESLSMEIWNKKCKNIIINTIYRPLKEDIEICEIYFKNLFSKNGTVNKYIVLAGDFNLNVLYFKNNKKVQKFINLMFR